MHKILSTALVFAAAVFVAAQTPTTVTQTDAGKKAIEKIRQAGGLAQEIAQNDNHVDVSYAQAAEKFSDELLAPLKDIQGLIHLDLHGLPVTDAQTAHLKGLTSLTRLRLERTKITDKGLENLKGLTNLEYLNVYGTAVTDAGLANLEGMKKLKNLYVWQTKVTPAGAAKLKAAIPNIDVNLGLEEKPPEKPKEAAKDKTPPAKDKAPPAKDKAPTKDKAPAKDKDKAPAKDKEKKKA